MDNKDLRALLQQLRNEIKDTQSVDEKGTELLRGLDGDIHALLERSEENPVQLQPSFVERLEDAIDHFEVTHPVLTTMIARLMDTLSNSGI
jgi:hypothetical protein